MAINRLDTPLAATPEAKYGSVSYEGPGDKKKQSAKATDTAGTGTAKKLGAAIAQISDKKREPWAEWKGSKSGILNNTKESPKKSGSLNNTKESPKQSGALNNTREKQLEWQRPSKEELSKYFNGSVKGSREEIGKAIQGYAKSAAMQPIDSRNQKTIPKKRIKK